jgi:hypothetical protein
LVIGGDLAAMPNQVDQQLILRGSQPQRFSK